MHFRLPDTNYMASPPLLSASFALAVFGTPAMPAIGLNMEWVKENAECPQSMVTSFLLAAFGSLCAVAVGCVSVDGTVGHAVCTLLVALSVLGSIAVARACIAEADTQGFQRRYTAWR
jgi:hypothetical protein